MRLPLDTRLWGRYGRDMDATNIAKYLDLAARYIGSGDYDDASNALDDYMACRICGAPEPTCEWLGNPIGGDALASKLASDLEGAE